MLFVLVLPVLQLVRLPLNIFQFGNSHLFAVGLDDEAIGSLHESALPSCGTAQAAKRDPASTHHAALRQVLGWDVQQVLTACKLNLLQRVVLWRLLGRLCCCLHVDLIFL